jgi:hypothetical protein
MASLEKSNDKGKGKATDAVLDQGSGQGKDTTSKVPPLDVLRQQSGHIRTFDISDHYLVRSGWTVEEVKEYERTYPPEARFTHNQPNPFDVLAASKQQAQASSSSRKGKARPSIRPSSDASASDSSEYASEDGSHISVSSDAWEGASHTSDSSGSIYAPGSSQAVRPRAADAPARPRPIDQLSSKQQKDRRSGQRYETKGILHTLSRERQKDLKDAEVAYRRVHRSNPDAQAAHLQSNNKSRAIGANAREFALRERSLNLKAKGHRSVPQVLNAVNRHENRNITIKGFQRKLGQWENATRSGKRYESDGKDN